MKYYISDTHFYHENAIKFDKRPFKTMEEMHQILINNWNDTIKSGDDVYILGDFCWLTPQSTEYLELLNQLKGNKHLILGNHDREHMPEYIKKKFASISPFKEITDNRKHVLLCHYPMPFYKASYNEDTWMLYGHVHIFTKEAKYVNDLTHFLINNCAAMNENRGHLINVGCMMPYMDWRPQPLEYLMDVWQQTYGNKHILD